MIVPNEKNIVIKEDDPKTQTPSGIILTSEESPSSGIVVAAGRKTPFHSKDRVFFKPRSGYKIEINEEILLVLDKRDVLIRIK